MKTGHVLAILFGLLGVFLVNADNAVVHTLAIGAIWVSGSISGWTSANA